VLNFLIGNYTNPIDYKDTYLGITFKLPHYTFAKHIKLNRTALTLLNFNYPTYNTIAVNYLIISNKIKFNSTQDLEYHIKELLEFINYPNPQGYKLYLLELEKIFQNPNTNNPKIIPLNLGFDVYIQNPFLIISERLLELRYLFRQKFIFKVEVGIKFLNQNELVIYILLSDTFFNDFNKSNWYKELLLNSIKESEKLAYTTYPIKINNKVIGNINLINNQVQPYISFNLIDYKLFYNILYPNSNINLQNGEIILNIINTYSNSIITGTFLNYLGKYNLNFYFNNIYNLNDILNLILYLFKSILNLEIISENIYNINLDALSIHTIKLQGINTIPLLIIFNDTYKFLKGFFYLFIMTGYNTAIVRYELSYYTQNTSKQNNLIQNNPTLDFNTFLTIVINLYNSINYDFNFIVEKMNYIVNKEKIEMENSQKKYETSKEISDIIYNEIRKENQHRSHMYKKLKESNEYSSTIFRDIQKGFAKDREAFTNAFSAAINNETYAKDPITNEIYRVPAYSGFDNIQYYRDNYNYYSQPEIYQVKSYDYQTKEYLESQGYKKMKTDIFGFVYEQ
jgi:hypothetical protein